MTRALRLAILVSVISAMSPGDAAAVSKCKVKIDKRNGVVRIDAAGVSGPLRWGTESGAADNLFYNQGTCVVGNVARRCELADPSTVASKTLPSGCTLYVDDGDAECSMWIRGCSLGVRESAGFLWKDSDGKTIGVGDEGGGFAVRRDGNVPYYLALDNDGFVPNGTRYYESADCTGQALLIPETSAVRAGRALGTSGPLLYPPATGAEITHASLAHSGPDFVDQSACDGSFPGSTFLAPSACCLVSSVTMTLGVPNVVDLSEFTPPFSFVPQQ